MTPPDRSPSRRALLRRTLFAAFGAVGLAACTPTSPASTTSTSGPTVASATRAAAAATPRTTLTLAVSRDLANGPQDPYFTHTSLMCHEPLIGLDDALGPVAKLARQWSQSEDGLTWTFVLRDGVTFTDGTPFDADAAIRNLRCDIQISPRTSPYTAMIARVAFGPVVDLRKQDSRTFQIVHSSPYPLLEATMSNFFSAMFSPASFADNGDFTGIPSSTGPWRLTDWQPAQTLTLERNAEYWGGAPPLERITVRVIPDANTRVSALVAGEVDAVMELGALLPAQAQQLQSMPDFVVGADPISITQYLHFNCSSPPFDDPRLRQVVSLAFDRESVVRNLVLGFATPGQSLLSPISKRWFSPKGTPRFDATAAANGDPDFIMGNFLYSQGAANTTSHGGYHNDEVDQLVAAGRQERDATRRFGTYERLQEIAAQEVPTLGVYHERAPYAYRRGLAGLSQRANFQPTLDTVHWT
jgi:peptide/nickel transport system substrate-binding protein